MSQTQKDNGKEAGVVGTPDGEETYFWGRVSTHSGSVLGGDWRFRCATICLLLTGSKSEDGKWIVAAKILESTKSGETVGPFL